MASVTDVPCIELPAADLVPEAWRSAEPTYVFNPAVVSDGDGLIAFYRVVRADLGRRIAACRLDAACAPIPGSARPFSDGIVGAASEWYADPRVYLLRGEHYLYWNTGFPDEGPNAQYLVRIDLDSLSPTGKPLRLEVEGPRQRIEKNWILFEHGGDIHAIYSIAPHRVLRLKDWGDDRLLFAEGVTTFWDAGSIAARFGPPRGGAQPLQRGDRLYHFCHASLRYANGSIYVAQCYEFEADPPFALTRFTAEPLVLPNPLEGRFVLPKLNPRVKSVVYPAGNLWTGESDEILLSYGVNDEAAFVAVVPFADVDRQLSGVARVGPARWRWQQWQSSVRRWVARRFSSPSPR